MATRQIVKAVLSAVTIVSVTALASAQAVNAEQDQWLTGRARAMVASKEGKPGDASAARNMERDRWISEQFALTDGSAR